MSRANNTVPWEAFDATHPDHDWYYQQTGHCLADDCEDHSGPRDCGV